jgi:DNA (cytosine-5)-methyltransferase 1
MTESQPTALGAYIFAGGFTLGVREHFQVLAHFEEGPFGVPTVRHNMPDLPVFVGQENWPIQQTAGSVDWLYGNPPCAPWSTAGHKPTLGKDATVDHNKGRYLSDERTKCTDRLFELLLELQPKAFTWESVARAYTAGKQFVDDKTAFCLANGYSVTHLILNGQKCGLAQPRKRFFFLAHRVALPITPPDEPYMTVSDAWKPMEGKPIGPHGNISKVIASLLEQNPAPRGGGKLMEMWEESEYAKNVKLSVQGYRFTRPGFLHARVHFDKHSPTVTGGQHLYHPTEIRHLSIKEQQLLCGYPYDYEFQGKVTVCYAQIARAVLPPVGKWLASQVRAALDANVPEPEPRLYVVNLLGGVYGRKTA